MKNNQIKELSKVECKISPKLHFHIFPFYKISISLVESAKFKNHVKQNEPFKEIQNKATKNPKKHMKKRKKSGCSIKNRKKSS